MQTGPFPSKRMENLTVGQPYHFRVAAQNGVGCGEMSPWSMTVVCRPDSTGAPPPGQDKAKKVVVAEEVKEENNASEEVEQE